MPQQPFEIISLSTDVCPVAPLEITIKMDTATFPGFSGSVTGLIEDYSAFGFLEYPFCTFQFPPIEKDSALFTVAITMDGRETMRSAMHINIAKHPHHYVERPYEFLGAKRDGFVLKKEHIFSSGPPNQAPHAETLDLISRHLISPVLDVGCGIGVYVKAFTDKGFAAKGIEVNQGYVEVGAKQNIDIARYDGKRIPFPDNSFATVTAVEVIEHVEDWHSFLNELLRVASKRVILTTPNISVLSEMHRHHVVPWHILESTHVNFFTCEIWRHILLNAQGVTTGLVKPYSEVCLNNDRFYNNIYVVMDKRLPC